MYQYMFEDRKMSDLNPLFVGWEKCVPNKSFGPAIRPYTLIHYVHKGKGRVIREDRVVEVNSGQAFLIRPSEVVTYTADSDDPWYYYWVGFNGKLSERFCGLDDVFDISNDIFLEMFDCGVMDMGEYRVAARLFELYVALFSEVEERADYVNQVKGYVKALYMQDISVEQIAHNVNLDRRYLTRIFKEKTGLTIKEYIIKERLKAACQYLLDGFSVEQTAILSGYTDAFNFSKIFKSRYGASPTQWRKQNSTKS